MFGFLLTTDPFLLVSAVCWAALVIRDSAIHFGVYCLSVSTALPMAYLMLALEIPLQIKFGQEKSRIVSMLLIGGMSAAMGLIGFLSESVGVAEVLSGIAGFGIGGVAVLVAAVVVVLLMVSYRISCRIMEKKEF